MQQTTSKMMGCRDAFLNDGRQNRFSFVSVEECRLAILEVDPASGRYLRGRRNQIGVTLDAALQQSDELAVVEDVSLDRILLDQQYALSLHKRHVCRRSVFLVE